MKRIVAAAVICMAAALSCGCSTGRGTMAATGVASRTDVFREARPGRPVPPGDADLLVVASLKTHREGVYPLRQDAHGTPGYELLLTIDGQTERLKGALSEEKSEPAGLRDPEAGDGVRYAFSTAVRLKAGLHTVMVASPVDGVTATQEISLAEKRSYRLELEPVYGTTAHRQQPAYYGPTSFLEGVKGFRILLSEGTLQVNP